MKRALQEAGNLFKENITYIKAPKARKPDGSTWIMR
jgi:hypothetical protein